MKRELSSQSFSILLILLFANGAAAQFPEELQPCFDSGTCTVTSSGDLSSTIRYFLFTDENGDEKFLMRYCIGGDANHSSVSDGETFADIPLFGVVWLEGQQTYGNNLGGGFTLYLEDVQPIEYPISNFELSTVTIWVGRTALLAGGGSFFEDIDGVTGNINADGILICLAYTCEAGAAFNLLGLEFVDNGGGDAIMSLNFFETRTHLYDQYVSFDGSKDFGPSLTEQSFDTADSAINGLVGDVNRDGVVNLLDVAPFVNLL